jgi:hypothetical protein
MSMNDLPAFEVRTHDGTAFGHVFRIWADGRIEGFPNGVIVNRIPQLMNDRANAAIAARPVVKFGELTAEERQAAFT